MNEKKEIEEQQNEMQEFIDAGYKYIITYWVHSHDGGDDDYFIACYKRKPTQKTIDKLLKNSVVKTDYVVHKIA